MPSQRPSCCVHGVARCGESGAINARPILLSSRGIAAPQPTSARTLHRQLKEEGATLQALQDEVRRERAMDLLQRSSKPVKQVAEAAGFQNEKSFIRAFRGWMGVTPKEWRVRS